MPLRTRFFPTGPSRRQLLAGAATGVFALSLGAPRLVVAQQPLRIVVGFPPGGGTDRAARLVAEQLQRMLGKPVIVENRPGAGGRTAAQQLVNTPADQPTLMIGNPAIMSVSPLLYKDLKYDPQRDFVPVAGVNEYEFAIATGSALPVRELSHLLAWVRANPDKAFSGIAAAGSLPHFFTLMLADQAKAKIELVPYKGQAPMMTDLLGGQIPMAVEGIDALLQHHKAGKLRVLATSGAKRSQFSPDIPTFKEQGLPVVASGWNILFAPSSMPKEMVQELGQAIARIVSDPAMQEKFSAASITPMPVGPKGAAEAIADFNARWAPVIKASGFKPEA